LPLITAFSSSSLISHFQLLSARRQRDAARLLSMLIFAFTPAWLRHADAFRRLLFRHAPLLPAAAASSTPFSHFHFADFFAADAAAARFICRFHFHAKKPCAARVRAMPFT